MTGVTAGDVEVSSLNIRDILDVNRPFYQIGTGGSRIVVMAEPVTISVPNMTSIQMSSPVTPPEIAVGGNLKGDPSYKAVAPAPKPPVRVVQPNVVLTVGEAHTGQIVDVLKGVGYCVAIFLVVWLVIKFARSDTAPRIMNYVAGGFSWIITSIIPKTSRAAAANALGVGKPGTSPGKQTLPTTDETNQRRAEREGAAGVGPLGPEPKPREGGHSV
jgi:hypothetical protein